MRGLVHHIELYVKDLEASKSFWGWFLEELGYHVYQSFGDGISYKLDKSYIVLVQTEERFLDIPYHRCRSGLNHLAFHGETKEFVDQMTEKIRAKGLKILYEDKHPYAGGKDYYAVFFEGPERMKLEIVCD